MIAVTGASGLLGANFLLAARERGQKVSGVVHTHPMRFDGGRIVVSDLTRRDAALDVLTQLQPQWLVHAAAGTNVDACESDPATTRELNVRMTRSLAEACERRGVRMIYISTDSVFGGAEGGYGETSPTGPINVYAATKLQAEAMALRVPGGAVIRTNIYGWNAQNKKSLAEWMLGELRAGRPFTGFDDVVFNPLLVNDLSDAILEMIDKKLSGVYHLGSSQPCSKREFGLALAGTFGLDPALVRPGSVKDVSFKARRPQNTWLKTDKIAAALGRSMPDLAAGLSRFKKLEEAGFAAALRAMLQGDTVHG